jgi:hypothetical protein
MGQQNTATFQTAPSASTTSGEEIDRLEFLNRIREGRIPPPAMMVLLGFDISEIERSRVVFSATPTAAPL